jgi:hypothetical protein
MLGCLRPAVLLISLHLLACAATPPQGPVPVGPAGTATDPAAVEGPSLDGRALGFRGPLAGATVTALPVGPGAPLATGTTDAAGRFHLVVAAAGGPVRVLVHRGGQTLARLVPAPRRAVLAVPADAVTPATTLAYLAIAPTLAQGTLAAIEQVLATFERLVTAADDVVGTLDAAGQDRLLGTLDPAGQGTLPPELSATLDQDPAWRQAAAEANQPPAAGPAAPADPARPVGPEAPAGGTAGGSEPAGADTPIDGPAVILEGTIK